MIPEIPKDKLIEMFVNKTLFNFLMKQNVIKKGDTICYGKMLGISMEDLQDYFKHNKYPGFDIPRYQIRESPDGGEGDSEWTLEDGMYKAWYTERNTHTCVFSSDSKAVFKDYWIKRNSEEWENRLTSEWIL